MDEERGRRVTAAFSEFFAQPPPGDVSYQAGDGAGRPDQPDPGAAAVALFHQVARSVPAYRDFLARNGADPAAVRTLADFQRLPLTTKENYQRRYPLPQLCRDGRLEDCDMIAVSITPLRNGG